ncbi:MAG: hypothetical protein H6631_03665 [Anaerolineaceae bacterium]|nr:hypothetical protein [Anaerolineaceae bacterium]
MVTNRFDATSKLHLAYPVKDKQPDIIHAVQSFIRYEQSRPPAEQLPHTPIFIGLLQQWDANDHKRSTGEAQRAEAAELMQQLDQAIMAIVRDARKTLDAAFPRNPAKAKVWGFEAKQTTQNILLPQSRDEHLRVLRQYIAKEQSRPEAERFLSPDLDEAIRVHAALRKQVALRRAGKNQREEAVATSYVIAAKMHNYLQAAATHLLAFKFDFILTLELQNWGFDVSPRRTASAEAEEAIVADAPAETTPTSEPAPAAPAPETAPTNGTSTNGSQPEDGDLVPNLLGDDWE